MKTGELELIPANAVIYIFSSYIGTRISSKTLDADYSSAEDSRPPTPYP
jgi:hypothetical protein